VPPRTYVWLAEWQHKESKRHSGWLLRRGELAAAQLRNERIPACGTVCSRCNRSENAQPTLAKVKCHTCIGGPIFLCAQCDLDVHGQWAHFHRREMWSAGHVMLPLASQEFIHPTETCANTNEDDGDDVTCHIRAHPPDLVSHQFARKCDVSLLFQISPRLQMYVPSMCTWCNPLRSCLVCLKADDLPKTTRIGY
jgi:hypothetical protein